MTNNQVLVVGGGTMGRGIAALCALSGFSTRVYEADEAARRSLTSSIEESWSRAVARGRLQGEAVAGAAGRLAAIDRLEVSFDCLLVVEAVPEDLGLKQRIFSHLDGLAPARTVLASNTSSLSIGAIAGATGRPDRVVGIHFFNPVAAMPLVEIVRGPATSKETEETAGRFVRALGKDAIRVADSPGFATSRLGLALGLEAMRMVEEGVASASDLDKAMELGYGHRMGPLKTSDLVGLDVRLAIAETLASQLDEARFRPPRILRDMVSEGRLGKKSGEGFYRWEGDTAREPERARERRQTGKEA